MNKRGQFFLIAALVIIGIFTGLMTTYNSAKSQRENSIVFDLTNEADFEASQIIDNAIFSGKTQNLSFYIENLSDYYSKLNPDSDILVLFKNDTYLVFILYKPDDIGSVSISLGNQPLSLSQQQPGKYVNYQVDYSPNLRVVLPPNIPFNYPIDKGTPFFIITRKKNGEQSYISSSDSFPASG